MKAAKHFLRPALSAIAVCATTSCLLGPSAALAQAHTKLDDPIPALIPASPVKIALRPILSGLVSPVVGAVAPGDREHLYVADQPGQIWRVSLKDTHSRFRASLFLDVKNLLIRLGVGPSNYDERGLLGLAFHPDFTTNGRFYTFTSQPAIRPADFSTQPPGVAPNCQTVITEWRVKNPGRRGSEVDLGSARELMRIDKPQFNHNGGELVFGPDRMLYISIGDGGAGDDEGAGHAPEGNAQSLAPNNVLGKILRIDPLGSNSANGKYGIPADNPLVGKDGADEIFAYGFRNPYRMSFDELGKLWVGEVGQNDIEEVDVVVSGGNYGWPIKEGSFLFDPNGPTAPGFVFANSPGSPAGLIDPIALYDHVDGAGQPPSRQAVLGGFVYRGDDLKRLRGNYVFGDYSGRATATGHLFTLDLRNQVRELVVSNRPLNLAVLGFGEDSKGELYLFANSTGTLTGRTGVVLKIVKPGRHHN